LNLKEVAQGLCNLVYRRGNTNDWLGKSCWLPPRESDPEVDQGPCDVITFPSLLAPVLVWNQQNYKKFLKTARYFDSTKDSCPREPPHWKSGCENECI